MPDLKPQSHPLGFDTTIPYKVFRDGRPFDLTGYTITLKFLAQSDGTTTFNKVSGTDTDWLTITNATEGEWEILIDESPSNATADETYTVGIKIADGTNTYRPGKIPQFKIYTPPEGAY